MYRLEFNWKILNCPVTYCLLYIYVRTLSLFGRLFILLEQKKKILTTILVIMFVFLVKLALYAVCREREANVPRSAHQIWHYIIYARIFSFSMLYSTRTAHITPFNSKIMPVSININFTINIIMWYIARFSHLFVDSFSSVISDHSFSIGFSFIVHVQNGIGYNF